MTLRLALAASLLALAACQPATTPAAETTAPVTPAPVAALDQAPANGCEARTQKMWGPIGASDHPSYRVEAWTSGPGCEAAVVTLAIYARDGFPTYAWASPVQYLFGLRDAKTPADMQTAITEWVGPDNLPPDMTGTLPVWEETDGQPNASEFPFMPRGGMRKEEYEALRKDNLHMLCFPQGIESLQCLALTPGTDTASTYIDEIGIQRFPG